VTKYQVLSTQYDDKVREIATKRSIFVDTVGATRPDSRDGRHRFPALRIAAAQGGENTTRFRPKSARFARFRRVAGPRRRAVFRLKYGLRDVGIDFAASSSSSIAPACPNLPSRFVR